MKKVNWKMEFEGEMPFCPYCDEPIYYKGECSFCGKKHEWVDNGKSETVVEDGDYVIVQAANNHIQVFHEGRMLMHINCTKKMTEDELRGLVAMYANLNREKP